MRYLAHTAKWPAAIRLVGAHVVDHGPRRRSGSLYPSVVATAALLTSRSVPADDDPFAAGGSDPLAVSAMP